MKLTQIVPLNYNNKYGGSATIMYSDNVNDLDSASTVSMADRTGNNTLATVPYTHKRSASESDVDWSSQFTQPDKKRFRGGEL
nr:hypothetical protein [Cressdnaviricota sp.]